MEHIYHNSKANFESVEKWLYLGADAQDKGFAKVGITMGDLGSRSSSSENPRYHLFCAFKCVQSIEKSQLEAIEKGALSFLEKEFIHSDGLTKRASHHESEIISECFYEVDFLDFFVALHTYLYENYRDCFLISGFENEIEIIEGEFIDCEFNKRMSCHDKNEYIRMILL